MRKGDLAVAPLGDVLLDLAADQATGCLHIEDGSGDEALIYLRDGLVYAITVPGRRPQIGTRLLSSGALGPEALAEALEAQRSELSGWRLGELLVHLGYVDAAVVEAFATEQLVDGCTELMRWTGGRWKFRRAERVRDDLAPPVAVEELLARTREREELWARISDLLGGPTAVPMLAAGGQAPSELAIDADAWSVLCKVDGERSIADLARECGFTLFEAGQVVHRLAQAALLDIDDGPPSASAPARAPLGEPDGADPFQGAIDRVSHALAALLGPQPIDIDPFGVSDRIAAPLEPAGEVEPLDEDPAERERREAIRAAAAAELAAAHAAAEQTRRRAHSDVADSSATANVADEEGGLVVDLGARRAAARRDAEDAARALAETDAWREHADRIQAEIAAAETAAWAEHADRTQAEVTAAETDAWAEHADRLADEITAAETDAWAEHTLRLAAQRRSAEIHAWAEHADRTQAEITAAETDAWQEYSVRLAHEITAAETDAWAEHTLQLAEIHAWAEHADRLADEITAAETDAWAEHTQRSESERRIAETAAAAAVEQAQLERQRIDEERRRAIPAPAFSPERAADADVRAGAVALLTEITQAEPVVEAEEETADELAALPQIGPEADDAPLPAPAERDHTDTASLLRELSSLGLDEEPATRPVARATPRPGAGAAEKNKKRKGLFGRG